MENFVIEMCIRDRDYPGVGPEHAYLHDTGRAEYVPVTDSEAVDAFEYLSRTEGIIPAIESAHAVAYARKLAPSMRRDQILVLSLIHIWPEHAGVCIPAVRRFAGRIPILGVCLGHQAICEAFGGTVSYAKELMHGKQRLVYPEKESRLFRGISSPFPAARYHSLAADPDTLPKELRVTAWSEDGEVMAVEHTAYPVFGVQFHPESVMKMCRRDRL